MTKKRDHIDLAHYSVEVFANDRILTENELDNMIDIILRDGVIDQDEERVFKFLISALKSYDITPPMREKIESLEKKYEVALLN